MSKLGVGVKINMLFGGKEENLPVGVKAHVGKKIADLYLDPEFNHGDGGLIFTFDDGSRMAIYDKGRSCCEARYMDTDDDLLEYVGAIFQGVDMRDGSVTESKYGDVDETAFLEVVTSAGRFTVNTYNQHNGYYGGFWIIAKTLEPVDA